MTDQPAEPGSPNAIVAAYKSARSSEEELMLQLRRDILEIVRSYRHPWDVLSEVLQNSVDAIKRQAQVAGGKYVGEITVEVLPDQATLIISDNGCGLAAADIGLALAPSGSLKTLGADYGYKGYGLTFACFVSKSIELTTTRDGKRCAVKMDGNSSWLATADATFPETKWLETSVSTTEPAGTTIKLELDCGQYAETIRAVAALDDMFTWAADPRALEYVLRTRTAIGCTQPLLRKSPKPEVLVRARIGDGELFGVEYAYLYPGASAYVASQYVQDVDQFADVLADFHISTESKAFRGLRWDPPSMSVGTQNPIRFDASVLVCGRTGMSKFAEEYNVKGTSVELSTGVHLAIDGLPTGITIEDWEGRGSFDQRFFVLVDAELGLSDQLDSGRKGISGYFRDLIVEEISAQIADKRHGQQNVSLRKLAQNMVDPDPGTQDQVLDIVMRAKERESQSPLDWASEVLLYPPAGENEVIALFAELITRHLLPGYRSVVMSQWTDYDGVFRYAVDLAAGVLHPTNPLGLGEYPRKLLEDGTTHYVWQSKDGLERFVTEFKLHAQDLVASRGQQVGDIELLVAWDADAKYIESKGHTLHKFEPTARRLFGITHELSQDNQNCRCILLKDVLEVLIQQAED
jgi:hypothetical protein